MADEAGPVGGERDALGVDLLPVVRRGARVVVATVAVLALASLAHLLWVDGVSALPASVVAAVTVGTLSGVPVGLVLAAWAELLRYMHRVEAAAWAPPEPEPAAETPSAPNPEPEPAVVQPAPPAVPEPPEQGWAEQWARALREPDARPCDVDSTVARVRAGSLLEVQAEQPGGELRVRRLRALRAPCTNGRLGGVGVWAVTEAAWQLHCTTGRPVPAERVWAELVVAVEDGVVDSERES